MRFTTCWVNEPGILEKVPGSIRLVSMFLIDIFCAEHETATVKRVTCNEVPGILITGIHIEEISSLGFNFETFVVFLGDDINNTSNRVSTIDSRCTVFQDLDSFDHGCRNRLVVTPVYRTFAVHQIQCTNSTHSPEIDCYGTVTTIISGSTDR